MNYQEKQEILTRTAVVLKATEEAEKYYEKLDYPSCPVSELVYFCSNEYAVVPRGVPMKEWPELFSGLYNEMENTDVVFEMPDIIYGLSMGHLVLEVVIWD